MHKASITLPAVLLREMKHLAPFMPTYEERPTLAGLHLDRGVLLVADAPHMILRHIPEVVAVLPDVVVTFPTVAVEGILNTFDCTQPCVLTAECATDPTDYVLQQGEKQISVRVPRPYAAYKQILHWVDPKTRFSLDRASLAACLKHYTKAAPAVALRVSAAPNNLGVLTVQAAGVKNAEKKTRATAALSIKILSGERLPCGPLHYNPARMLALVELDKDPEIAVQLTSLFEPAVIKTPGAKSYSVLLGVRI